MSGKPRQLAAERSVDLELANRFAACTAFLRAPGECCRKWSANATPAKSCRCWGVSLVLAATFVDRRAQGIEHADWHRHQIVSFEAGGRLKCFAFMLSVYCLFEVGLHALKL